MIKTALSRSGPIAALVLVACLAACAEGPGFKAPEEAAPAKPPPPAPESRVMLEAQARFSTLSQAIGEHLPQRTPLSGTGSLVCANVPSLIPFNLQGQKQCANYSWQAYLTPEGPAQISRVGDALKVEQPVRIDGSGGLSGDLAKALSLNARTFQAHLAPGAVVKVSLDQNWCPVLDITPTERWITAASVEVLAKTCVNLNLGPFGKKPICVGPANLDLTGPANLALKNTQNSLISTLRSQASCDKVRSQVAGVWKTQSIPLGPLPGAASGAVAYINVVPTSARLSQLFVGEDRIRLIADVSARVAVETHPIAVTAVPLPPLGQALDQPGGLDLSIQAIAPYATLKGALATALIGQTLESATPAGKASARIMDAALYPSGQGLAIGVQVAARLPGKVLDDTGWIYLTGKPVALADGRTLKVVDLKDSAVLHNTALKTVILLFNGQILDQLNRHAEFDLTDVLQKGADQISDGLSKARITGLSIAAGKPVLKLTDVAVGPEGVYATASIRMPLSVEVSSAIVPQAPPQGLVGKR